MRKKTISIALLVLISIIVFSTAFSACSFKKTMYVRLLKKYGGKWDENGFLAENTETKEWIFLKMDETPYDIGTVLEVTGKQDELTYSKKYFSTHYNGVYNSKIRVFDVHQAREATAEKPDKNPEKEEDK